MDPGIKLALAQIDAALVDFDALEGNDSTWESDVGAAARTRCVATLQRLAPTGSGYGDVVQKTELSANYWDHKEVARAAAGSLRALRADFEAGYLTTLEELIHADLFADFLDMAGRRPIEGVEIER